MARNPFFTERERAALAWTEAVTTVGEGHVAGPIFEHARRYFNEKELVDLTLAAIAINAWNRLAISFRTVPGTYNRAQQRAPGSTAEAEASKKENGQGCMARREGAFVHQPRETRLRRVGSGRSRASGTKVSRGTTDNKSRGSGRRMTLWTVGHSTRPIDDFIALLQAHGIRRLVDVRTIPRSRHNPQFNQDQLPVSLASAGIQYVHTPGLGGLRHARSDSINTAWRNASFRGFADYMQTAEFDAALKELMRLARSRRTAIMCAEAVPWRCHRSMIADALVVRGIQVEEITGGNSTRPHALTPWACLDGDRITYPAVEHEATPTE